MDYKLTIEIKSLTKYEDIINNVEYILDGCGKIETIWSVKFTKKFLKKYYDAIEEITIEAIKESLKNIPEEDYIICFTAIRDSEIHVVYGKLYEVELKQKYTGYFAAIIEDEFPDKNYLDIPKNHITFIMPLSNLINTKEKIINTIECEKITSYDFFKYDDIFFCIASCNIGKRTGYVLSSSRLPSEDSIILFKHSNYNTLKVKCDEAYCDSSVIGVENYYEEIQKQGE